MLSTRVQRWTGWAIADKIVGMTTLSRITPVHLNDAFIARA